MNRRFTTLYVIGAALAVMVTGCNMSKTPQAAGPVFDVAELDTTVNACTDFNSFVNAKWVAANPIPSDRSRWGAFDALSEKSLDDQHAIVTEAADNADQAEAGSIEQKIGYLFRAGMDSAAIDAAGYDPIKPKLASIAALKTSADIVAWLDNSFAEGDQQRVLLRVERRLQERQDADRVDVPGWPRAAHAATTTARTSTRTCVTSTRPTSPSSSS